MLRPHLHYLPRRTFKDRRQTKQMSHDGCRLRHQGRLCPACKTSGTGAANGRIGILAIWHAVNGRFGGIVLHCRNSVAVSTGVS